MTVRSAFAALLLLLACAAPAAASIPVSAWGPAQQFAPDDPDAGWVQLALAPRGDRAVAVWPGDAVGINYRLSSSVGAIDGSAATWTPSTPVEDAGYSVSEPQLRLSADGARAVAIWIGAQPGGHCRVMAVEGVVGARSVAWGAPQLVADEPGGCTGAPSLALSTDGSRALAAWAAGSPPEVRVAVGEVAGAAATWSAPQATPSASTATGEPAIAVSADGARATAVWRDQQSSTVGEAASAAVSASGLTWGAVSALSSAPTPAMQSLRLALSADGGRAVAAWGYDDGGELNVAATTATVAGAEATWASDPVTVGGHVSLHDVELAASSDGTRATLLWTGVTAGPESVWSRSAAIGAAGATWGDVAHVSGDGAASQPSLALSGDGATAQAAWAEGASGAQQVRTRSAEISGTVQAWGISTSLASGGDLFGTAVGLSAGGTRATALWSRWDGTSLHMDAASAGPGWRTLTVRRTGRGRVVSAPAGVGCGAVCAHAFDEGASVRLRAAPAPGWAFARWGGACTGRGTCALAMRVAHTVTARFERGVRVLSTRVEGAGAALAVVTRVRVPAAGRLRQVGVALTRARSARVVCRAAERVDAGTAEITCPLGLFAQRLLAAGALRATVTTWFASSSGAESSARRVVLVPGPAGPVTG